MFNVVLMKDYPVHIWASGYDQVKGSLIHVNTKLSLSSSPLCSYGAIDEQIW